jgi:uracil-DNA glycosylase
MSAAFGALAPSWECALSRNGELAALAELARIRHCLTAGSFYPPGQKVLRAFRETAFENVKVVILGRDPYTKDGEADGLAFSVSPTTQPHPQSLRRIFCEVWRNGYRRVPTTASGDLTRWACQGVLLMNTILTVAPGGPSGSHRKLSCQSSSRPLRWECFTDACLRALDARPEPIVFMFWGNYATPKADLITGHDCVLLSAHPQAGACEQQRAFSNSDQFREANSYLWSRGTTSICW